MKGALMHHYKLIVSTVLIIIVSTQCIQAAADNTIDFKTSEWPVDKTLTVDPNKTVAHSIVLTDKEPNSKKSFQKLWKHAKHKNVPWILLCQRITLGDNSSFIQYSDPIEIIKKSGISYDKKNFASATSTDTTVNKASKALLIKLYPEKFMCQATQAFIWSSDIMEPYNSIYTIKHKQGSKQFSDLSCTLAIQLCHDYSQLVPIISLLQFLAKKHDDKRDKILFKEKFWLNTLHMLPQKTQDRLIQEATDIVATT